MFVLPGLFFFYLLLPFSIELINDTEFFFEAIQWLEWLAKLVQDKLSAQQSSQNVTPWATRLN